MTFRFLGNRIRHFPAARRADENGDHRKDNPRRRPTSGRVSATPCAMWSFGCEFHAGRKKPMFPVARFQPAQARRQESEARGEYPTPTRIEPNIGVSHRCVGPDARETQDCWCRTSSLRYCLTAISRFECIASRGSNCPSGDRCTMAKTPGVIPINHS